MSLIKKVRKFQNIFLLAGLCLFFVSETYAESKNVRVGYYENEIFQEGAAEGKIRRGYAYEYYRKISEYTGWEYQYEFGDYIDLYKDLQNGKIDVMAGMAYTKERASMFLYPERPMGRETYNLMKKKSEVSISSDPASLNGKKIGVIKSVMVSVLEDWLKKNNISPVVQVYNSQDDAYEAFDSGNVDVLFIEGAGTYGQIDSEVFVTVGGSDFYLCVSKNRPDLLEKLNEAQGQMFNDEPNFLNSLHLKYFPKTITSRAFSEEEISWLKSHGEMKLGYLKSYLPYSDMDSSGHVDGLIRDYIPALRDRLGLMSSLKTNFVAYDSYSQMISELSEGKIDAAFPVGGGLFYSEVNGIFQSAPVVTSEVNLIFKGKYFERSNPTIAVDKNNLTQFYYVKNVFPYAKIEYFDSTKECLEAVSGGKADFVVMTGYRSKFILRNRKFSGLNEIRLNESEELGFGINIENVALLKILNRGIGCLGHQFAASLCFSYGDGLYEYSLIDFVIRHNKFFVPFAVVMVSLVLVLISLENRRNRKFYLAAEQKNRELQEIHKEQLFQLERIRNLNSKLEESATEKEAQQEEIKQLNENLVDRFLIIRTMNKVYFNSFYINLLDNTFEELSNVESVRKVIGKRGNAQESFQKICDNLISPETQDVFREFVDLSTLNERMKDKDVITCEYNGIVTGWSQIFFIAGGRNREGNLESIVVATRKINEEKIHEEELKLKEKLQLETISEAIHGGFKTSRNDKYYSFKYVSAQLASMLGYTLREFWEASNGRMSEIVNMDDVKREMPGAIESIHNGEMYTMNYRMRCKDGSWKNVEDRGRLIRTPGKEDEFWCFIVDKDEIMEKTRALEVAEKANRALEKSRMEVEKAKIAAENASMAKTSFLFNMSHDIRTPMNAIIGFTDLLEKYQDDSERRADYLKKIKSSSSVLLSIINNVLEMARIEKGVVELDETAWSVEQFSDALCSVFNEMMREKGIEFTREINVQHNYVFCDSLKLREIFINIISNAYKYTEMGGKVSLKLEELPSEKEGWAIFKTTVSDTGVGMSKDYLPHIFEEFSREHNTTENKIEGTGLGMSIVKRLLGFMDGTIEVQSEEGKGTTFSVTIPHRIAEKSDLVEQEDIEFDPELFKGKRILLAEDNELNAEIATEILSAAGFEVDVAENGKVCIQMLGQAPEKYYSVILMDIQMPELNGYDAAKQIRRMENAEKAGIPIIAMTANAFEEDKREAVVKSGMNGHVAKPIDVRILLKELSVQIS